jgi:hypothetical protein
MPRYFRGGAVMARHLFATGAPYAGPDAKTLCGLRLTEYAVGVAGAVHVSKARRTDCHACRQAFRDTYRNTPCPSCESTPGHKQGCELVALVHTLAWRVR